MNANELIGFELKLLFLKFSAEAPIKETPMNRSTTLNILATTMIAVNILSCQQDAESRNPNKTSKQTSTLSNSVIARVSKDPNNSAMGKLELVASNQAISKSTHASQIASAFNSGQPLGLKKEGMALTASNSITGTTFALYECPPGYYSPSSPQTSQVASNQPNIGIDNIFSTFSGEGGGLFNSLLDGFGGTDGGGILESLSGSLQSIIGLFSGSSTGTVAVPDGQTISDYPSYGCVPINNTTTSTVPTYTTNTATTTGATSTATTATGTSQAAPTPYPYIGQVQSGPYTYYTYALPSTSETQPVVSGQQN
jgi:hypothetical protein